MPACLSVHADFEVISHLLFLSSCVSNTHRCLSIPFRVDADRNRSSIMLCNLFIQGQLLSDDAKFKSMEFARLTKSHKQLSLALVSSILLQVVTTNAIFHIINSRQSQLISSLNPNRRLFNPTRYRVQLNQSPNSKYLFIIPQQFQPLPNQNRLSNSPPLPQNDLKPFQPQIRHPNLVSKLALLSSKVFGFSSFPPFLATAA